MTRPVGQEPDRPEAVATTTTAVIFARPGDGWRARRIRRWARRELDRLLRTEPVDPWTYAEPIDWHSTHMDLGVREREQLGEEFAQAGWSGC